jgi:FixJ family two-component response regulator
MPSSLPATVYVVDDDVSFAKAVTRLLRAGGHRAQSFTSVGEFLGSLPPEPSGCILLDLQMPGRSGFDLQSCLSQAENPLPIIFLTGHGDIPGSVRAMQNGAVDFLTKPVKKEILFDAIKWALARDAEERAKRVRTRALKSHFATLTSREKEVMLRVIGGRLNKQIAFDLSASERTIKAHRAIIMNKLDVGSVAELVRLAEELGLQPIR